MSRLALRIRHGHHAPSLIAGHPVEAIRLLTRAAFATTSSWTPFREFVVDTGAPISLIPSSIWRLAKYQSFGRTQIAGLARRPECQVEATLAEVECVLSDGRSVLGPLKIYAYLADTDLAPALIGMSGFLQHGELHVQVGRDEASIEM